MSATVRSRVELWECFRKEPCEHAVTRMMTIIALHSQAVACVTLTLSTSVTFTMSSVAHQNCFQFREGQKKIESKDEMGRIQDMTLEQLAKERISFRQGQDGDQAFSSSVRGSLLDRLVHSDIREEPESPSTSLYVQYVLKRLDHEIVQNMAKNQVKSSEKLKDRRASASADSDVWDQISELDPVEAFFEMPAPAKIQQVEGQVGESLNREPTTGPSHHEHGDGHAGGPHACTSTECEVRAVENGLFLLMFTCMIAVWTWILNSFLVKNTTVSKPRFNEMLGSFPENCMTLSFKCDPSQDVSSRDLICSRSCVQGRVNSPKQNAETWRKGTKVWSFCKENLNTVEGRKTSFHHPSHSTAKTCLGESRMWSMVSVESIQHE